MVNLQVFNFELQEAFSTDYLRLTDYNFEVVVLRLRSGFPLHCKFDLDLRFASILGIV